jgi:hypothetical protein
MTKGHPERDACVEMVGSDARMDQRGNMDLPVNALPAKCRHCTFPDLDFVPQPYFLAKGVASPVDTAMAEAGNFFVRVRARRILELAAPGACDFYPTEELKTKQPTPWSLAVPRRKIRMFDVDAKVPRCPKCGEFKLAHPGTHYVLVEANCRGVDVFKSLNWHAWTVWTVADVEKYNVGRAKPWKWPREYGDPPTHPGEWRRVGSVGRDLYFSVRLEQLFKKAKVKGILRSAACTGKPTPADVQWVEETLRLLADNGLADSPAVAPATEVAGWFARYVKRHAKTKPRSFDFAAVEAKHGVELPEDYKQFMSAVGPASFEDVNGTEGFAARVLPPAKLDFREYRRGKVPDLEADSARVDGVMFAVTEHGDCFVFDVSGSGQRGAGEGSYAVFWYDHEQNVMEPYAASFAECIKRFAQKA